MSSRTEWCTNKLSKLLNEELRITTLNEIKEHFGTLTTNEATETANLLELPLVFDCLNDSNTEQVDLACEVLTLCMTNLNIGESTNKYSVPLERALNHPYANVKLMALKELERYTTHDVGILSLSKHKSLLHTVVKSIADNELSVAAKAMSIIVTIGQSDVYIKYLVAQDMIKIFEDCMNLNEVIRLRFYEVFINIAKVSEGHLNLLLSSGLLKRFLEELESKDILILMNMLELISNLVTSIHGYKFLQNRNILDSIFCNTDPLFESTIGIGALRLFGHLAHWKPAEMLTKYSTMTNKLFLKLNEPDLTTVGVALDTIAYIGESNEGKIALEALGDQMIQMFHFIKNKIVSFQTPLCVRALNVIENLLKITDYDARVEDITKKWFDTLDDVPMDFTLKYAKNPFVDIRLAGLGILISLTTHKWGQEYIKNYPGLVEFLLDRSTESFKDCKQLKYDIVTSLAMANTVFDQSTLKKFKAYVNEGPYYVQTIMEVAVEGNE